MKQDLHLDKEFQIALAKNELIHNLDEKVKEKTKEIEKQNESLAEKNKSITDSIQCASRIQNAILPERKLFETNFPDSFIFYRPRDIVSGDFYLFSEKDEHVLLAVADCTGHGVPGR